jgi:hypothetical protein
MKRIQLKISQGVSSFLREKGVTTSALRRKREKELLRKRREHCERGKEGANVSFIERDEWK